MLIPAKLSPKGGKELLRDSLVEVRHPPRLDSCSSCGEHLNACRCVHLVRPLVLVVQLLLVASYVSSPGNLNLDLGGQTLRT